MHDKAECNEEGNIRPKTFYCLVMRSQARGFLLLLYFSDVVWHPRDLQVSQYVVSLEFFCDGDIFARSYL